MSNRYTVMQEEPYTIEVFYDGADVPGLRQPFWPNGEPWESAEEAEEWALQFIESIENEEAPYAPNGRGEERQPKPDPEEEIQGLDFGPLPDPIEMPDSGEVLELPAE